MSALPDNWQVQVFGFGPTGGPHSGPRRSAKTRFFEKLFGMPTTDECIIWPFPLGAAGYGTLKRKRVHRVVCELVHGAPFKGADAAHSCDVKACVNSRHLRWATRRENEFDKVRTGAGHGERGGGAKLTTADVMAIRASDENYAVVAARYGISAKHFYNIRNRRKWKHV